MIQSTNATTKSYTCYLTGLKMCYAEFYYHHVYMRLKLPHEQ